MSLNRLPSPFALLRRPLAVWVALWVMVLAALAPAVTHAVEAGLDPSTADLCSATKGGTGAPEAVPGQAHTTEHCPQCVLGVERSAPLPTQPTNTPPARGAHERALHPLWVSVAARTVFGAPPRGPPLTTS